jgi:Trp operon repressor
MTRIRLLWWRARHHEDLRRLAETKAELERVRRQWPIVHDLVATLTHHRERNGFSESIAHIYRGGN